MQITEEQIKEIAKSYISENLRVELSTDENFNYDGNNEITFKIDLILDEQIISTTYDRISVRS